MSHYAHHNLSPVTQITIQQILRTVAFMSGLWVTNARILKCIGMVLLLVCAWPSPVATFCCRDVCVCIPWACPLHQPAVFQHIFGRVEHRECSAVLASTAVVWCLVMP